MASEYEVRFLNGVAHEVIFIGDKFEEGWSYSNAYYFPVSKKGWDEARAHERELNLENCFHCLENDCRKHNKRGCPRSGLYSCDGVFQKLLASKKLSELSASLVPGLPCQVTVYPDPQPERSVDYQSAPAVVEGLLLEHAGFCEENLQLGMLELDALFNRFTEVTTRLVARRRSLEKALTLRQDALNARPFIYLKSLVLSGRRRAFDENFQGFQPFEVCPEIETNSTGWENTMREICLFGDHLFDWHFSLVNCFCTLLKLSNWLVASFLYPLHTFGFHRTYDYAETFFFISLTLGLIWVVVWFSRWFVFQFLPDMFSNRRARLKSRKYLHSNYMVADSLAYSKRIRECDFVGLLEELRLALKGARVENLGPTQFEDVVACFHAVFRLIDLGDKDFADWIPTFERFVDWGVKRDQEHLDFNRALSVILCVIGTNIPFMRVDHNDLEGGGPNRNSGRVRNRQAAVQRRLRGKVAFRMQEDEYAIYREFLDMYADVAGDREGYVIEQLCDKFYEDTMGTAQNDYGESYSSWRSAVGAYLKGGEDRKELLAIDGRGAGPRLMKTVARGIKKYNDQYECAHWTMCRLSFIEENSRKTVEDNYTSSLEKILKMAESERKARSETVAKLRTSIRLMQEQLANLEGGVECPQTQELREKLAIGKPGVELAEQITMQRALTAIKLASGEHCTTFGEFCEGVPADAARVSGHPMRITDFSDSLLKEQADDARKARDEALRIREEKAGLRNKQLLQQLIIKPRMQLHDPVNLEGKVQGCNPLPRGVVAVVRWPGGGFSNGYFARFSGGVIGFITHRHGTNPIIGQSLSVFSIDFEPFVASIKELWTGPKRDHFDDILRIDFADMPTDYVNSLESVKWARPCAGEVLRGAVSTGGSPVRWQPMAATVPLDHVKTNNRVGSVGVSTFEGYCRFGWFNKAGKLVGGHRYRNVHVDDPGATEIPGFDVDIEIGDPNFAWKKYVCTNNLVLGVETNLQALTKEESPGVKVATGLKPGHVAAERTWLPNPDLEFMAYCLCKHIVMKPAAEEVVGEIRKFDSASGRELGFDSDAIRGKFLAIGAADSFSSITYLPIRTRAGRELLASIIDGHLRPNSSSGVMGDGRAQKAYLTTLGDGDLMEGKRRFAGVVDKLLCNFEDGVGGPLPEYWATFGKEDKYSAKKVTKGDSRSIQGCSILMKTLWLYCFSLSDVMWSSAKSTPYEVSLNRNAPVRPYKVAAYSKAEKCYAYDVKQFDRAMPAEMMVSFFRDYLPLICKNIPSMLIDFFQDATVDSLLVQPDGRVFKKHGGNPSGFPNTIRLNCVVLRAADELVAESLGVGGYRYAEYCGDDLRLFCDAASEKSIGLDYQLAFQRCFPWELTLEGVSTVCLDDGTLPDFVATTVMRYNNNYYNVTADTSRQVAKLLYIKGAEDADALAERVYGVVLAMIHNVVMHLGGRCFDPTVDFVLLNYYPTANGRHELYQKLCELVVRAGNGLA